VLRKALWTLGILVALAFSSYALLVRTDWGRNAIREYANEQVSAAMTGDLAIEHLDLVDLPHIRARGVRILAPDGKPCIEVEHIDAWLDLGAIWDGFFAWQRAEIRGGIVHVTEDAQGRVNMAETFRRPPESPSTSNDSTSEDEEEDPVDILDLRTMVTSNMVLVISGGSLPSLRMVDLDGTMRVHVLPNGDTELRFDDYSGDFVKGLPTGLLNFREVKGHVQTAGKRLLRFEGSGKSEDEPVEFVLDIHTEPKQLTEIDAHFPKVSKESIATRLFALWTKFIPGLDLTLHRESVLGQVQKAP
jgi:hypothetical protein